MSNYIPGNQKHLTLNDRLYIENELAKGTPFKDIAAFLCKDPTTISKEVRAHRISDWSHKGTFYNAKNFCIHRYHCKKTNACGKILLCGIKCASCPTCNQTCKDFEKERCKRLDKAPSLFVRRKAMRVGTMSILLAVFACISILNMLGVSALSTERTYFDRYKNNWDFLVTVKGDTYSEELLNDIRNTEDVAGCIVHRIVNGNTQIPADYLSSDVQKLSLEKLNSSFAANEAGAYNTKVPIFILDDKSFAEYRGDANDANVVAVNIIWDSVNSERTDRQYVPFLNEGKEIDLNVNGKDIPVSAFNDSLPVLREELTQYALTLVMSESYYATLGFDLKPDETIYTIKMTDESKNDALEEKLQGMLETYPGYAFEGRVQELADEMQIQQGLRMIIYLFTVILTCIGLANIFASTLGQIHQRKREFARYFAVGLTPKGAAKILAWEAAIVALRPILLTIVINIPLMAWMLDAGGITAGDFIAKRLPLAPAILLFVAVIGFVALAYYLGGKKICDMNLVEAIKDDTLML